MVFSMHFPLLWKGEMHIHLAFSQEYFLFVWAPSSRRKVLGRCIHEGKACPNKRLSVRLRGAETGALIREGTSLQECD